MKKNLVLLLCLTITFIAPASFFGQDVHYVVDRSNQQQLSTPVASTGSQSAWRWLHPSPNGNMLRGCKMWNATTMYAWGWFGTFLKTSNAGANWSLSQNAGWKLGGQSGDAVDAHFFDINHGILLGPYGLVETHDGGETFDSIPGTFGSNNAWTALHFINAQTGFAVSFYNMKMMKTTNGGQNWSPISSFNGLYNNDMYVSDDGTTIITCTSQGNIVRSSDGGLSWNTLNINGSTLLFRFAFINSSTGFVIGSNGTCKKTTDAGLTWVDVNSGLPALSFSGIDIEDNKIFLSGSPTYIYTSTDEGNSWQTINIWGPAQTQADRYIAVDAISADTMMTVGYWGQINTIKGSATSCLIDFIRLMPLNTAFNAVQSDEASGKVWAVGPVSTAGFDQILYSSNRGFSWISQYTDNSNELKSISMLDSLTGYACGNAGVVVKTTNGGLNWITLNVPTSAIMFDRIDFVNAQTGWVFGWQSSGAAFIHKTTNGGMNWVQQTGPNNEIIMGADMVTPLMGCFVGTNGSGGAIYKTVDGGENWLLQQSFPNQLIDIYMANTSVGYLGGAQLVAKTTDGGTTWTSIPFNLPTYQLQSIDGVDELNVSFVMNFMSVYKTSDGGTTWDISLMPTSVGNNNKIDMVSTSETYNSGFGPLLLKQGGSLIGISQNNNEVPVNFILSQNYPNPFNPTTTISYSLPLRTEVTLSIYDITGRVVGMLLSNHLQEAGTYSMEFNGEHLASGVYFYMLQTEYFIETKKMVLIK